MVETKTLKVVRSGGFCSGAKRAFEAAEAAAATGKATFTWGPILHHPSVTEALARMGVAVAKSLEDVPPGSVLVLPAHGAPKGLAESAAERGVEIRDAICPLVLRVRKKVLELEQRVDMVFIAGWKNHTESKNLVTWARGPVAIVETVAEMESLEAPERVGLAAQTTFSREAFEEIAEALMRKRPGAEAHDTGCAPTRAAQNEAAEAAKTADAVIALGGAGSANTARLAEICGKNCNNVIRIERAGDLAPESVRGMARIALAAGASTPDREIEETVKRLKEEFGFHES